MRRLSVVLALFTALLVPAGPAAATTPPPLPSSMSAVGDSITRAFDATAKGCLLLDCLQYSWSTGTSTSVLSHYRQILAKNTGIEGQNSNDARTGAKMVDLAGQLKTAADRKVDYVTVLMGANDLCTASATTMTSVEDFRRQFDAALRSFFEAHPQGRVFVSSLPDLYRLWTLFKDNRTATRTWQQYGICQSMLASRNTEDDRTAVVEREKAFNLALHELCLGYVHCRSDGGATFGYELKTTDVSTVDYFHPSVSGQDSLAKVTWKASYWGASS